MKYTLELRTTISPTPYFFRRIHFLAASLRTISGDVADHEIVVSVGGGANTDNYYRSEPWSNRYPITWRQVPLAAYAELGYRATNRDRASYMSRAQFAMLVDADVIFLSDFSELLSELRLAPAICGVMAHDSPFIVRPALTAPFSESASDDDEPSAYWRLLAERFGVAHMPLEHQLSGWGITSLDPEQRFAPAYFNGGMVIGPSELIEAMCRGYAEAEAAVDDVMDTYFRPQLARTLAIYRAGLAYRTLPLRYNFPNDPRFDDAYPGECAHIAILHYLRQNVVHRDRDFADRDAVDRLIARSDLTGSNEALRRRVGELRDLVFGEEAAGA